MTRSRLITRSPNGHAERHNVEDSEIAPGEASMVMTADVAEDTASRPWPRRLVWLAAGSPLPGVVWVSVHHLVLALVLCLLVPLLALPNLARRRRHWVIAC